MPKILSQEKYKKLGLDVFVISVIIRLFIFQSNIVDDLGLVLKISAVRFWNQNVLEIWLEIRLIILKLVYILILTPFVTRLLTNRPKLPMTRRRTGTINSGLQKWSRLKIDTTTNKLCFKNKQDWAMKQT